MTFSGETALGVDVIPDAFRIIAGIGAEELSCKTLSSVKAEVLSAGDVPPNDLATAAALPSDYERWTATLCGQQVAFLLGVWPARAAPSHFEGAATSLVRRGLAAYQNDDGGFGNALEPDKRDPHSQPVDVQVALETMDAVGDFDIAMAKRACACLTSVTTKEGGVPFALPSVNAYPRAPWWQTEEAPPANLNPTAAIVGVLLKHRVEHPWVAQAEAFCWRAIAKINRTEFHELMPVIAFLSNTADRAKADKALTDVLERIAAPDAVALDPDAGGYVHMPLEWAPRPDSPWCRKLFSDAVIARHLDALANKQKDDGGWPISWDPVSPAVELEWRGIVTINALRTLKAYGRAL